jgi:hypothetical protein
MIPEKVDAPMDYTATRPCIMDHAVTLEVHSLLLGVFFLLNFLDYVYCGWFAVLIWLMCQISMVTKKFINCCDLPVRQWIQAF